MWSINKQEPIINLPKRFRKEDGLTVTDLESLTNFELEELGILEVDDRPEFDEKTQKVTWTGTEWKIETLTDEEQWEIKNLQWSAIRLERDNRIEKEQWKIQKHLSEVRRGVENLSLDIGVIDTYIEQLREIPQTQTDPWNISWPVLIDEWNIKNKAKNNGE